MTCLFDRVVIRSFYRGITCANGATFDQTMEGGVVNCLGDDPLDCSTLSWSAKEAHSCTCPEGYSGFECQLQQRKACASTPGASIWDGGFVNNLGASHSLFF